MPFKRNYKKRRPARKKRVYRVRKSVIPRPKVYPFHRTREELLALENPSAGATGWVQTTDDCVVKTFAWNLSELPNYTEFTGLYEQYKINMAILQIFPTYSSVVSTDAAIVSNNMIITIWPNVHGQPLTAAFARADLHQIQRKRQFMLPTNRPTKVKMFLRQLSNTYGGSAINTDFATVKPRYINTLEPLCPHYGMNVHISRVDRGTFTTNSARLLIKERVYLTCKQVK